MEPRWPSAARNGPAPNRSLNRRPGSRRPTVSGGFPPLLALLAIVNTVASLYYYLRWLVPAFLGAPSPHPALLSSSGTWERRRRAAARSRAPPPLSPRYEPLCQETGRPGRAAGWTGRRMVR